MALSPARQAHLSWVLAQLPAYRPEVARPEVADRPGRRRRILDDLLPPWRSPPPVVPARPGDS